MLATWTNKRKFYESCHLLVTIMPAAVLVSTRQIQRVHYRQILTAGGS